MYPIIKVKVRLLEAIRNKPQIVPYWTSPMLTTGTGQARTGSAAAAESLAGAPQPEAPECSPRGLAGGGVHQRGTGTD